MTQKEKARELHRKYYEKSLLTIAGTATIFWRNSVQLAELAVDEIIRVFESHFPPESLNPPLTAEYWRGVREELGKILSDEKYIATPPPPKDSSP